VLNTLLVLAALTITVVSGVMAFGFARGFVRRRLRFVDAVRSPLTPFVAGAKSGVAALRRGDVG
jgi:hypothetical protein